MSKIPCSALVTVRLKAGVVEREATVEFEVGEGTQLDELAGQAFEAAWAQMKAPKD